MAWINTVAEKDAQPDLRAIYEASKKQFGFIPNIRRALSLNPRALRAYTQFSAAAYSESVVPPREREMIATVVSATNHCHY